MQITDISKTYLEFMLKRLDAKGERWADFYALYLACAIVDRMGPRALTPEAMVAARAARLRQRSGAGSAGGAGVSGGADAEASSSVKIA